MSQTTASSVYRNIEQLGLTPQNRANRGQHINDLTADEVDNNSSSAGDKRPSSSQPSSQSKRPKNILVW
jgi:hypothetical protein